LISNYRSIGDSGYALASWYLMRSVTGDLFTPEDMICRINALTKDDIVRAAKSVRVQTIYFLRGVKEELDEYTDED
ncbi:MAG TPA: hypothetical protein PLT66_06690, partial [Bacillota bacterium]|nr:hypothetical protein [Bacillota bacterium]